MSGIKPPEDKIPAVQWSSAIIPFLDEGHQLKIPLSGLSMFPLLVGGRDEAVISTTLGKKIRRGDIALYVQADGTHVLHRIHHIKNNEFYMLGDAQTWIEGPIRKKSILAVAVAVVRKGKTISCRRIDYRVFSALWLFVRPLRPSVMHAAIRLRRLLRRK